MEGGFQRPPKYKDGKEIDYTVTDKQVSGVDASTYTTSVIGNATDADGFTVTKISHIKMLRWPVESTQ